MRNCDYVPTTPEEDALWAEAEQQNQLAHRWQVEQSRDLADRQEVLQMTINQLCRHIASGETTTGDLASMALLAKELECTVPEYLSTQPRDF